uniref:DRBM domain-containing protein n=1 Tax=Cacopsylla melanoneura TaxID=428564 RepID=A0A8D8WRP5_9HEMI
MVLHEMYPDIVYKIDEVATNKTSIYRVHFEMDKKQFAGEGFSKTQAKQNACEHALKAMLLERIAKEQEAEKAAASEKEKNGENMETDDVGTKIPIPTDDFPWGKLAGFAMQKLMDSWTEKAPESATAAGQPFTPIVGGGVGPYGGHQTFSHPNHMSFSNYQQTGGFQFPREAAGFQPSRAEPKKPIVPCKKFPENPLEYNPIALCNQTWPNMEPVFETSRNAEGQPVHTATLTLEGFRFSALGKNKKEVKLQLSKAVLSKLKGIKYADGYTAQVVKA